MDALDAREASLLVESAYQDNNCLDSTGVADSNDLHNGPDELTCAICLGQIPPPDLAMVAGCEHLYCVNCILSWTLIKETPSCPQCKHKFEHLFVHRQLDGTITDFPIRETVALLQRAPWFEDKLKAAEKEKAASASYLIRDVPHDASHHPFFDEDWVEDDEDDELENFYFSSAAGRARIIIGNRRFGENGFMQSGRQYARPAPQPHYASKKHGKHRQQQQQQQQPFSQSVANGAGNSNICSESSSRRNGKGKGRDKRQAFDTYPSTMESRDWERPGSSSGVGGGSLPASFKPESSIGKGRDQQTFSTDPCTVVLRDWDMPGSSSGPKGRSLPASFKPESSVHACCHPMHRDGGSGRVLSEDAAGQTLSSVSASANVVYAHNFSSGPASGQLVSGHTLSNVPTSDQFASQQNPSSKPASEQLVPGHTLSNGPASGQVASGHTLSNRAGLSLSTYSGVVKESGGEGVVAHSWENDDVVLPGSFTAASKEGVAALEVLFDSAVQVSRRGGIQQYTSKASSGDVWDDKELPDSSAAKGGRGCSSMPASSPLMDRLSMAGVRAQSGGPVSGMGRRAKRAARRAAFDNIGWGDDDGDDGF